MSYNIVEDGHISSPSGYRATGVSAGLKEIRARDLALVYSLHPCRAAALFTTNVMSAASVYLSQAVLSRNREQIRAVLINAGHANAGTGPQGLANAIECAKMTADEVEVPRDSVLLMSTGQIGVPLPMDRMREGIRRAASELDSGAGRRAALAILTTDTRPKERALRLTLRDGRTAMLAGMAKGGRMVHPRLASMLALITTDAQIDARLLSRSLEQSAARSFGRLSLDGDISPNDTLLVLANGASGTPIISDTASWEFGAWQEALDALCHDLAQQIVRDAADKAKVLQVHVRGAVGEEHARQIATAVVRSASVRWMCARSVPDWGSVMVAVGASGAELRPDLLEIRLGPTTVMTDGAAARYDNQAVVSALSGAEIEITIDLHMGTSTTTLWTCTPLNDML
ncbi:MAG TPA: bifunctional glutamate N-acetyltransferase/amino-acid acetyltransferase ArgJ [Roseiflexaceae bacterium]|nr:bifunctional glutamate N-acetyltransferase/amino-acid acetyltransferase ArgJ [Roseiflexaceae bacterium]